MLVTKEFWFPLTSIIFFDPTIEINRIWNYLLNDIHQNIFFCVFLWRMLVTFPLTFICMSSNEFQFTSTSIVWWKKSIGCQHSSKCIPQKKECHSNMFVMTSINDDRMLIFGWTVLICNNNKLILPVPRVVRSWSVNLQLQSFSTLNFPTWCRWAARAFREPPTRSFQDRSITSSWARNGSNMAEVKSKQ